MSYAVKLRVQRLVKTIIKDFTSTTYTTLETDAIEYSDNKINSALRKESIPIPTVPNPLPDDSPINDLVEAGCLYAAAYIFNDYFSAHDRNSSATTTYRSDADTFLNNYIKYYNDANSVIEDNEINTNLIGYSNVEY